MMEMVTAGAGYQETRSVCPYCGTGCGVILEHDEKRVFAVRGDPAHPANCGALYTKGRALAQTVDGERLASPLRRARRGAVSDGSRGARPWARPPRALPRLLRPTVRRPARSMSRGS